MSHLFPLTYPDVILHRYMLWVSFRVGRVGERQAAELEAEKCRRGPQCRRLPGHVQVWNGWCLNLLTNLSPLKS